MALEPFQRFGGSFGGFAGPGTPPREQVILNGLPWPGPEADFVMASEPPMGTSVVPGIPDAQLSILGDLGRIGLEFLDRELQRPPTPSFPKKPESFKPEGAGPCPGLFEVRGPDGTCINLSDVLPGGDPFITGQQPRSNGVISGFGEATFGRYGVGVVPRVEVQSVRRCPAGMALGKDGICYDGLSRNSQKRQWPMGMKPLLTPGERNAIRIAARAANKLARSKKSLKKAATALTKVC